MAEIWLDKYLAALSYGGYKWHLLRNAERESNEMAIQCIHGHFK